MAELSDHPQPNTPSKAQKVGVSTEANVVSDHGNLSNVTTDQHHPQGHVATHAENASDELLVEDLGTTSVDVSAALRPDGTGGASFSDIAHADTSGRTVNDHHNRDHATTHEPSGGDAMAVDAVAPTGSLRTIGTGALQGAAGNHSHIGGVAVGVRVTDASTQAISHNSNTAINFDQEDFDSDAFHDNATNNTRLTVPSGKAGKYLIIGGFAISALDNSDEFRASIRLNGTTLLSDQGTGEGQTGSLVNTGVVVSTIFDLAATDYVELMAFNDESASASKTIDDQHFELMLLGT